MDFLSTLTYTFLLLLACLFIYGRSGVEDRQDAEVIAILMLICFIGFSSSILAKVIHLLLI